MFQINDEDTRTSQMSFLFEHLIAGWVMYNWVRQGRFISVVTNLLEILA